MSLVPAPVTAADRAACSAGELLSRVGDKWSVLLLALLADRPYGFNELDRAVHDLSRRILTRALRQLERDGLVRREVRPGRAAGVAYSTTDLGRSLLRHVVPLGTWALEHEDEVRAARARFDGAAREKSTED